MNRKPKPIHQQAREKGLTEGDARELQLFREFLRTPGGRQSAYERVYGRKAAATPPDAKGTMAQTGE